MTRLLALGGGDARARRCALKGFAGGDDPVHIESQVGEQLVAFAMFDVGVGNA
jgi:hypothetical protein